MTSEQKETGLQNKRSRRCQRWKYLRCQIIMHNTTILKPLTRS